MKLIFNKRMQIICFLLFGVGVLAGLFVLTKILGIPFSRITRDPLAVVGGLPYIGMVSNMGAILWSFSAAVCLFSSRLMSFAGAQQKEIQFLFWGGVLSSVLLVDDLFMLHELMYPYETLLFVVYAILMAYYLYSFRIIILYKTSVTMLLISLCMYAMSILTDRVPRSILPEHHLFEDGAKYLAIVAWLIYQARSAFLLLKPYLKRIQGS